MDFTNVLSKNNPHQRTIIHLDMDCFYAQVEEVRDPTLKQQPLGVQQKSCVVTCNYVARKFGVKKLMSVAEALQLCPNLVLINGEDLTPYRQMSQRIHELLLNYTPAVEKLGSDENYMDVTALVQTRLQQLQPPSSRTEITETALEADTSMREIIGNIYPVDGTLQACACGCAQNLAMGTQIAKEIRDELLSKLGMTCCAGISYNKLLAKLVGAQNKPNQQTVLVSTYTEQFTRELRDLHRITGIGQKTESLLLESGIANVEELQNCDMDFLRKKFGFETATKLKDLSFGRDMSAVRATGKPKSIGLEDSFRPISVRTDVEERFRMLLMRLVEQVADDGRIPIAIKVILRKFDVQKKASHRETKQANILPSLFRTTACTDTGGAKVLLAEGAQEKLLKIIMRLFERVVDLSKPFNITLIGLAFSKFQQRKVGSSSIANFLIKKADLEVQSITSLTNTSFAENVAECTTPSTSSESKLLAINVAAAKGHNSSNNSNNSSSNNDDEAFRSSPTTFQPSDQFYRRRTTAASPIPMLTDNGSESGATNSDFSDFSETEIEPSPKKSRISRLLMAKRRCLGNSAIYTVENADVASPSKLRVCDLRLNSRDSEKDFYMNAATTATSSSNVNNSSTVISTLATTSSSSYIQSMSSGGIQRFRTIQPPSTLLTRMEGCPPPHIIALRQLSTGSSTTTTPPTSAACSPLPSPMDDSNIMPCEEQPPAQPTPPQLKMCTNETLATSPPSHHTFTTTTTTITGNLANIPCPAGVDPQVFNELPLDVQNELIASWRNSLAAAAAAAVANSSVVVSSLSSGNNMSVGNANTTSAAPKAKAGGATANGAQKNTLYRYFLRNK